MDKLLIFSGPVPESGGKFPPGIFSRGKVKIPRVKIFPSVSPRGFFRENFSPGETDGEISPQGKSWGKFAPGGNRGGNFHSEGTEGELLNGETE